MATRRRASRSGSDAPSRTSRGAARSTVGGPAAKAPAGADEQARDVLQRKMEGAQKLAAGIRYNATKALEYGDVSAQPPEGECVAPDDPRVTASTLSETSASSKAGGDTPMPGVNRTTGSLDRVRVDSGGQVLTTNQGVPVGDNQSSLKAGLRGAALLEDFILREKITHFDHERIPERIVHARGSGAHGFFESYASHRHLTRASLFAEAGKRTPVFVRFSTVAGERGSTDLARDVRGFAVKFYTDEGNWDLVGNNIPVFFIQDAIKFPDLVHALKPEPHNGMPQAASAHDTFWDFVSLMPESTHMLMWVMSDRAIPRSFRMMQGFGVHTFRFVTEDGASRLVKFHWSPTAGTHSVDWDEAVKISGADPDFHRRDLWEAIEAGAFPEWELGVQIFTEEEADRFTFDVLDATKIVPEELVPITPLGRMVLNRNPDNFFAETEQVAFCTAHVVPGIDFTNDPLLAGRIHSYVDTQISRLGGPNFHEVPINAPVAQIHNNQRDGMHRQAIARGRVAYEPNSLGGGCPYQAGERGFMSFLDRQVGDKIRGKPERFAEHFNQAALFWNSQTPIEKAHILRAFRFELSKVQTPAVRERVVSMLANVTPQLAEPLADQLGMKMPAPQPRATEAPEPEIQVSNALSLFARKGDGSIRTRRIALLVANGVDGEAVEALQSRLTAEGAVARMVGARLGTVETMQGERLAVDATAETTPSVLYDAIAVPGGKDAIAELTRLGQAAESIKDQYRHCKPILALGAAKTLLEGAGVLATLPSGEEDPGVLIYDSDEAREAIDQFVKAIAAHRHFARHSDPPVV